jgi:hypothetical protein
MPSCADCPSFLEEDKVIEKFRKNFGAPACAKYGHVLGRPGSSQALNDAIQTKYAEGCDSYGAPRPPLPAEARLLVALPDPVLRVPADPTKKAACNTCGSCQKFVREDSVIAELGWAAGICAARGKLIFTNRQSIEAADCEYREWGPVRDTTNGLQLLPEFDDSTSPMSPSASPIGTFIARVVEAHPDPQLYETDKEVTEEEQLAGIRAWRKVSDPDRPERFTHLPIYRTDFFSEEEQKKIPKVGDEEHPEFYQDHFGGVYLCAVAWNELDETPCAWGEAGVGKTELFRHLAFLMGLPFERFSITAATELDELMGRSHYTEGVGTHYEYGRLPLAWAKPCVVCLDEPNTGPVEVWQRLRPLTDNSKQLIMDEAGAEHVDRNDDCYPGLAMNPAWDPKNIGALPISDADVNRLFHVYIELPDEATEKQIIASRVRLDGWELSADQLRLIMKVAVDLRAYSADDKLPITWGLRPQIKVARALAWFEPMTAYRRAIGDYLEPQTMDIIRDVVNTHLTPRSSS